MPDYELDGPQAAWQHRIFIPDHAVRTVQSKYSTEGENQALSMSYTLPPARLFLSSQLVSKIFLFTAILLLHQKTGAKAKNSVNSLCSAPVDTAIT